MSLETTTQPVTRCLATVCVLMTCALADSLAGSDVPTPTVLEFHSGDFVRGKLLGIEDNKLEWDGEFFSQPFTFPLDRVAGIKRAPEPDFAGEGEFVIELTNRRDMLFGDLLAIDEDTIELRSKWLGQLKLRRDVVRRLTRNGEDGRLYPVPARLNFDNRLCT